MFCVLCQIFRYLFMRIEGWYQYPFLSFGVGNSCNCVLFLVIILLDVNTKVCIILTIVKLILY